MVLRRGGHAARTRNACKMMASARRTHLDGQVPIGFRAA